MFFNFFNVSNFVMYLYVNKIHFFNIISTTKSGLMFCSECVVEFLLLKCFLYFYNYLFKIGRKRNLKELFQDNQLQRNRYNSHHRFYYYYYTSSITITIICQNIQQLNCRRSQGAHWQEKFNFLLSCLS